MGKSKSPVSSLSYEEMEELGERAEEAARAYILSRVPRRKITDLTVAVDAEKTEEGELNVNVDVEVRLSSTMRNFDVEELVNGAVEASFKAVEEYLGN